MRAPLYVDWNLISTGFNSILIIFYCGGMVVQKRGGVELEKNRFVLEHKICDLRRQIDPKEEAIAELRAQIEQMEGELNAVGRTQKDLELQVKDAK